MSAKIGGAMLLGVAIGCGLPGLRGAVHKKVKTVWGTAMGSHPTRKVWVERHCAVMPAQVAESAPQPCITVDCIKEAIQKVVEGDQLDSEQFGRIPIIEISNKERIVGYLSSKKVPESVKEKLRTGQYSIAQNYTHAPYTIPELHNPLIKKVFEGFSFAIIIVND